MTRYIFTTSPPRAGTIEFTPTPATYAPNTVRSLSRCVRIRGPEDRAPGVRAEAELDDLARERQSERVPLDLSEVLEEDGDGVEERAQERQGTRRAACL